MPVLGQICNDLFGRWGLVRGYQAELHAKCLVGVSPLECSSITITRYHQTSSGVLNLRGIFRTTAWSTKLQIFESSSFAVHLHIGYECGLRHEIRSVSSIHQKSMSILFSWKPMTERFQQSEEHRSSYRSSYDITYFRWRKVLCVRDPVIQLDPCRFHTQVKSHPIS